MRKPLVVAAFVDEESERHDPEGHVSVPAVRGANMIIRKADLTFPVTEDVFDPEALALDANELSERILSWSIADGVVNLCGGCRFRQWQEWARPPAGSYRDGHPTTHLHLAIPDAEPHGDPTPPHSVHATSTADRCLERSPQSASHAPALIENSPAGNAPHDHY